MLPWKSIIKIEPGLKRAQYLQIADAFIGEITSARIQPEQKLPGSRELASLLGINRKTVILAYDELIAQGWIDILPSRGTFVKKSLPIPQPRQLSTGSAQRSKGKAQQAKPFIGTINDGTPDPRIAPIDSLYKHCRRISQGAMGKSVLYGEHFYGEIHLREELCNYLQETRAVHSDTDNIMITRGSQMALFLVFSHLLKSGGKVIVGDLNYQTANETIEAVGGKCLPATVDEDGLSIEHIRKLVADQGPQIKAVYVTPHHQYPTTVTMPINRRLELMELAREHDFLIVEDDYDYDYHYLRSPILPIASIDQDEKVIYIGSFSKMLSPSIRIGYMSGPKGVIKACMLHRKLIDRRGDPVTERALAEMLKYGEIQRHLKKAVNIYHSRRDLLAGLLHAHLGDQIEFRIPDGGMAFWLTFKNHKIKDLIKAAEQKGLRLDIDTYSDEYRCRMGFASMNEVEMKQNIEILSGCTTG